jgi:hypothetical protein
MGSPEVARVGAGRVRQYNAMVLARVQVESCLGADAAVPGGRLPRGRLLALELLVLLAAGLALCVWQGWLPLGREPTRVAVADLRLGAGRVVTTGLAHYPVRVAQAYTQSFRYPTGKTLFLFPLFAPDAFKARDVRVLVLSETPPEPLLDFEERTVRGVVRRPTKRWLSHDVTEAYKALGYRIADDLILLIEDPPEE